MRINDGQWSTLLSPNSVDSSISTVIIHTNLNATHLDVQIKLNHQFSVKSSLQPVSGSSLITISTRFHRKSINVEHNELVWAPSPHIHAYHSFFHSFHIKINEIISLQKVKIKLSMNSDPIGQILSRNQSQSFTNIICHHYHHSQHDPIITRHHISLKHQEKKNTFFDLASKYDFDACVCLCNVFTCVVWYPQWITGQIGEIRKILKATNIRRDK